MAFSYGFYDSVNGDRRYNALEMSSIFDGIITDGILPNFGDEMRVVPAGGMGLIVKSGRAWFNHTWNFNSANLLLKVNEADKVLTRYDMVVLEVNTARDIRANTIKMVTGIASTSPIKPALVNTDEIHQYPLCYLKVNPKMTAVTQNLIEDTVGTALTPLARGKMQATDISEVFAQWNGEFEEWYNSIKDLISVGNIQSLQNQINQKLNKSDKADASTPINDNTKYLTPATAMNIVANNLSSVGTIMGSMDGITLPGSWMACSKSNILAPSSFPELFSMMGQAYGFETRKSESEPKTGNVPEYPYADDATDYSPNTCAHPRKKLEGAAYAGSYVAGSGPKESKAYRLRATLGGAGTSTFIGGAPKKSTYPYGSVCYMGDSIIIVSSGGLGIVNGDNNTEWADPTGVAYSYIGPIVAVVDEDPYHYIVFKGRLNDNWVLRVITFTMTSSGGNKYAQININSSYTITLGSYSTDSSAYGGAWVFNNQIYYIFNNILYNTTYGSTNSIQYTGPNKTVCEKFCRIASTAVEKWRNPTPETAVDELRYIGCNYFSLDNKISVAITCPIYYDRGKYKYVKITGCSIHVAVLRDEYSGIIDYYLVDLSNMAFMNGSWYYANDDSSIVDIKPFIKKMEGEIVIGAFFVCGITTSINGYGKYSKPVIFVGATTLSRIKKGKNKIYTYRAYEYPNSTSYYFNDIETYLLPIEWHNTGGVICEQTDSLICYYNYMVEHTRRYGYTTAPFCLALTANSMALPWLNEKTGTQAFYIRVK